MLARAVVVAFVLLGGGIGGYFLFMALAEFLKSLAILVGVVVGGTVLIMMFSSASGGGTRVNARGRARVQVHTGGGHNRGRRR
ncbi:hypothetical protein ACOT81_20810 [Streptomyces sp. WI04-05B]|uniref:hypothetical protein n=1 Tax=Streptomyces TaxID=1883 RepID=UPI0029A276E1|nr:MULTISPECIES: hypothetical protein [unclassified Streptomyces]MDX2549159.1 hypothetical protein [Streptomyces sp. WI04-05B]MDX2590670.1 hypothetical protein [Streptomyces sp. WI04-05A]